ncbi:hypothetical protein PGT21_009317 [Puccinia graminis f. sp. tritici]|uniref:Uncharacterized protein n=1 Tax=Puccinia graminis f. sp. tritici TaxID=56615 RepID=A0A5B0N3E6_PUCGR|nr:hypothetical protein PGT21_009317 [Puccinia graminis f. sp. tritici]
MPDGLSRRPPDPDEEDSPSFDEDEESMRPHPGFGTKAAFSVQLLGTTAKLGEEVLDQDVDVPKTLLAGWIDSVTS